MAQVEDPDVVGEAESRAKEKFLAKTQKISRKDAKEAKNAK